MYCWLRLHSPKQFHTLLQIVLLTKVAFTLIVPYPSADCNTIHTFFINFWIFCDRKNLSQTCIYRIAKELQLLYPIKFGNSLYFVVSTLKKAVLAVFLRSVKFFVVKLFGGKHGIAELIHIFVHFLQNYWVIINPFSTNISLLYPQKIFEKLRHRSGTLVENGLTFDTSYS